MQMFSLTFLVTTLVALFVAKSSSGHPTDALGLTTNSNTEIGGISFQLPGGKICCTSTLDRSDYVAMPGIGAFKVHKRKVTWNEARKICLMEGAQLAVLDSTKKQDLFKDWLRKESLETLWLGFHDLFENGSWTTVTGDSVDTMGYHPWAEVPCWPGCDRTKIKHRNYSREIMATNRTKRYYWVHEENRKVFVNDKRKLISIAR